MPERPQARPTATRTASPSSISPQGRNRRHEHEFDDVIIRFSEWRITLEHPGVGTDTVTLPAGRCYHRPAEFCTT